MKTENGQFDVQSLMDDGAKQAWTTGRWAGKVTVHDLVKHLQSLGRLATVADIDAYVASAKSEDLDKPLTRREIRERFQGKKSLDDMPVTRALLIWLRSQRVNGREANMDFTVWKTMKTRANKEGRQIDLALGQALFATVTKVIEVKAAGPDTTVIDYQVGGRFTCAQDGCAGQSIPQMQTLTDPNGQAQTHKSGPLEGQPLRVGDFLIRRGTSNSWEIQPLCHEHRRMAIQAGLTTYPFGDAQAIVDSLNAEEAVARDIATKAAEDAAKKQRDFEAMKKLAESSPKVALKQKYQSARDTRDMNRTRRK